MKVLLKRTFYWAGVRYRKDQAGTEVPDDAVLPEDAQVQINGEWALPEKDESGLVVVGQKRKGVTPADLKTGEVKRMTPPKTPPPDKKA